MPQAVLGVAFSFGIPMAFAAVQSRVPLLAWVLLLGNLFWVLAYDTEYAMVDRDDDLRIGIKTSAITLGRADVAVVMACYGAFLAIWLLALAPRELGWPFHLGIAAAVAQAAVALAADPRAHARRLLPGLPPEPLGGLRGVRRHRRRLRAEVARIQSRPNSSPSSAARRRAACMAWMKSVATPACSIAVSAA